MPLKVSTKCPQMNNSIFKLRPPFLGDKTTLPNDFGMNGHQKHYLFSKRKPIKGQELAIMCPELSLTTLKIQKYNLD